MHIQPPNDARLAVSQTRVFCSIFAGLVAAAPNLTSFTATSPSPGISGRLRASAEKLVNALEELQTHLRGPRVVLRSKTPELVIQEFYGLLLAHLCVRCLMHEAAHKAREEPDRLSFTHCVQVIRRKLPIRGSFFPSGTSDLPPASSD
jgi:hypothetical protein